MLIQRASAYIRMHIKGCVYACQIHAYLCIRLRIYQLQSVCPHTFACILKDPCMHVKYTFICAYACVSMLIYRAYACVSVCLYRANVRFFFNNSDNCVPVFLYGDASVFNQMRAHIQACPLFFILCMLLITTHKYSTPHTFTQHAVYWSKKIFYILPTCKVTRMIRTLSLSPALQKKSRTKPPLFSILVVIYCKKDVELSSLRLHIE